MKKVIAALVIIASFAANADYLWWMIDTGTQNSGAGNYAYNSFTLYQGDTALQTINYSADLFNAFSSGGYLTYSGDLTASSSYYVELISSSSDVVARSQSYTYSELLNMGSIFKGSSMSSNVGTAVSFGSFTAVPEPTSGVLMLLGGMLLGLKRRRMV